MGAMAMNRYEEKVHEELRKWKLRMKKKPSMMQRFSKQVQNKVNTIIPEKIHTALTEAIKTMVKTTLTGANWTTKKGTDLASSLQEKDELALQKLAFYRKTAMVEGAGTGAGGIFLSLADFPLLLSIKMKFLFEVATVYGYDVSKMEERVYILHVFQLAFSSEKKRHETMDVIENWETYKHRVEDMDWKVFQQEYRDYIDFVKMLQLLPGIGAAIGAYANYQLLETLGETAINCYRMRCLKDTDHVR